MQKVLIVLILVVIVLYFLSRKIVKSSNRKTVYNNNQKGYLLIESGSAIISRATKNTLFSVAIGVVLLIITLWLALKVKIILLMLPISLYLISQIFLLSNQLKYVKNQQIWYNPNTNDVQIEWTSGNKASFNLLRDVSQLRAVKSVQKNNQILFGYYEISVRNNQIYIPFLIEDNARNSLFFKTLKENFQLQTKSSLYPII